MKLFTPFAFATMTTLLIGYPASSEELLSSLVNQQVNEILYSSSSIHKLEIDGTNLKVDQLFHISKKQQIQILKVLDHNNIETIPNEPTCRLGEEDGVSIRGFLSDKNTVLLQAHGSPYEGSNSVQGNCPLGALFLATAADVAKYDAEFETYTHKRDILNSDINAVLKGYSTLDKMDSFSVGQVFTISKDSWRNALKQSFFVGPTPAPVPDTWNASFAESCIIQEQGKLRILGFIPSQSRVLVEYSRRVQNPRGTYCGDKSKLLISMDDLSKLAH